MNEIFWFIPRKTSNNILSVLVFLGNFVVTKFENDDDNNRSICSRNRLAGGVSYDFIANNVQWEDETNDAIPAIARSDQKCEASWCWRVSGTNLLLEALTLPQVAMESLCLKIWIK